MGSAVTNQLFWYQFSRCVDVSADEEGIISQIIADETMVRQAYSCPFI